MASRLRTVFTPRPDITPEQARDARARTWRYVFDCYARRKGGTATYRPNDGKELKDVPADRIIPK